MEAKGQGTIEYLVIIAIVVVISLIVVGILITQTSSVSTTDQKTTNLSWKAKELQITDFVADASGNGIIFLASNLPEGAVIESIEVGSSINSSSKQVFFGSTQRFSLTNIFPCTMQNQEYEVKINYISKEGLSKSVSGKFFVNCVDNALVLESIQLLDENPDSFENSNFSIVGGFLTFNNSEAISTNILDNFLEGANVDGQLNISQEEIILGTN